ncbi:MAG: serine/threonine protein kinase [Candidatus Melainabacteria bacterium]|nr:serine/threonine protein kinase [Candidatus Melainabacteria bacterium]
MATKNRKKSAKIVAPETALKKVPAQEIVSETIAETVPESIPESIPESVIQSVSETKGVQDVEAVLATLSESIPEPQAETAPLSDPKTEFADPHLNAQLLCEEKVIRKYRKIMKEKPWLVWAAIVGAPFAVFFMSKLLMILAPIMVFVLLTFAYQELNKYLPFSLRESFERWFSRLPVINKYGGHVYEGIRQIRPFLMAGVTFWSGPFLVVWMLITYVRKMFSKKENFVRADLFSPDKIIIEQSVSRPVEDEEDANFYHSPAFAITLLGIFALGLPAAVTVVAYNALGIDAILGFPSREPGFNTKIILCGFYISSFAWCMCALFFRAWFTYPLNFYSNAYDVVLDENAIDKKNIKGWFAELVWFCYPEYLPVRIKWKNLHQVKITQGGFGRLHPLPDNLFSKDSLVYRLLNRCAAYTDAIVDRVGRCDFVEFRTAGAVAQSIKLRLWQMTKEDRARVFYAIRKWAPLTVIPENVQQELLGSTVLAETRYTQIWFDLLTSRGERQRKQLLEPGDRLKNGELVVTGKLDSGGQANVYLARRENGQTPALMPVSPCEDEPVVIKEFILTGDEDMGNLIESAADFENEGSILARLDHPNVVKLHDVFTEDRRVYLVLEHVEGQSLRQLVSTQGPVSESEALRLAGEMCKVLTYLHQIVPPIVHRDFTPDNLILMPDGSLKVIDFSVAGSSVNVKDGDCVGKHSYTPAEQFRGQPCPQSDLYALGATLYFLTVGADPPPITQLHPAAKVENLSASFDSIVARLTANSLQERYETAAWLDIELSALRENSYIIV